MGKRGTGSGERRARTSVWAWVRLDWRAETVLWSAETRLLVCVSSSITRASTSPAFKGCSPNMHSGSVTWRGGAHRERGHTGDVNARVRCQRTCQRVDMH